MTSYQGQDRIKVTSDIMKTLEDIYVDIGGFNKFQILMIACIHTMKIMAAWSMMLMSFGNIIPDYHCLTDSDNSQSNFRTNKSANLNSQSAYSNESLNVCSINGTGCTHYVFTGPARTVVSEWFLICDMKWIKPTITSVQMAGVLVGALLAGQCGDYFGRKKTTYGWYLEHALSNLVAAFSMSWQMFIALRFFLGMGIGAILVMAVPYPTEFLTLKWRILTPVLPMWAVGTSIFAMAAWLLEDWSHLHLACAAFHLPGLLGYLYIPESARWLAVHERLKEARQVVEKMAQVNGRPVPSYTNDTLQQIADDERKSRENGQSYSYIDIVRGKRMFLTTLIYAFHWIALSIIYYGLSFGVSSFAGNIYLNIFLMGIMDIPGALIVYAVANKIGRRFTCVGFFALGCAASFGCLVAHLTEDERGAIINGLSLTAKLGVSACWGTSQLWVIENYPTVTRNLGYGAANTAARIGGILAPFAVNLDYMAVFSYTLIGGLQLVCILLTFLVPETNDTLLPESLNSLYVDSKHNLNSQYVDSKHKSNTGPDSKHKSNTGPDSKHKSNTGPDSKHKSNTGPDSKHKSNTGPDSKHKSNTGPDSKHKSNTGPDSKHKSNTGPDSKHKSNTGPDSKHESSLNGHYVNSNSRTKNDSTFSKDGGLDTKHQEADSKYRGVEDQTITKSTQPEKNEKVADYEFNTKL